MISPGDLKSFVREGANLLAHEDGLSEFELYCSSAEQLVTRLNFTSDIPSRGVEECKSLGADGFALRVVMRRNPHETGAAFEAGDLSLEALRAALSRSRATAAVDSHFPGLPKRPRKISPRAIAATGLMKAGSGPMIAAAWTIIGGAMRAVGDNASVAADHPGLLIGGDLMITRDRFALASSAFGDLRSDEAASFSASITAMIESLQAKGTATAIGATLLELRRFVPGLGREAVTRALSLREGVRPGAGKYSVVLGPQPLAEILSYIVVPSLTTGAFHAASTTYYGRFGGRIMDERLSLIDEPQGGGAIKRRVTCEGLPARRSELIRDGRLVGLLSNYYDAHRLSGDENRSAKLGPSAPATPSFAAANGYRIGEGGARRFDSPPSALGSNLFMRTRSGVSERELIRQVGDGIYIGRVWYTYPINGQRAGDFTCTISGDSYIIKHGKLAAPLAPNALRINAKIEQIFSAPIAIGRHLSPAVIWGSPEAYYVPAIAVDAIDLSAVGA
ncbi:MAG: metallopeptidase TldD-related protein [Candidatus Binataceae bacterium]